MILIWEEEVEGVELEPGVFVYEVHQHDYNMGMKVVINHTPTLPVRATLVSDGKNYILSLVGSNNRSPAQFYRRM